jgi:aldehyde:ferredoxin oxidoreductase
VASTFQKIIRFDLSRGLIGEERLPGSWYRDYIGGLGLAMQYLLEDLGLRKPILQDPIIVMTGPLTGSPVPATSKAVMLSYRGDTKALRISSIEGKFPAYLKLAGFDGLVITGASQTPVRVFISSKESKIIDASGWWGKDVLETEQEAMKDLRGLSTLTIGPAGEKGNVYAGVISDGFINAGPGMGADFGSKKLKQISLNPDSAFTISSNLKDFLPAVIKYIGEHFSALAENELRHSCFACVKCCGRYHPEGDFAFLEKELEKLRALFPKLSLENLHLYCRECIRQGIDLDTSARAVAGEINDRNVREVIARLGSGHGDGVEECLNTRSWEEAYLFTNQWHRDVEFGETNRISAWVENENLAMVKNCLPLCERWSMPVEDMVLFLNALNGSNYSRNDLLAIGENLICQTMGFYRDSQYRGPSDQETGPCRKMLPSLLVKDLRGYLYTRNWRETGYPDSNIGAAHGMAGPRWRGPVHS